MRTILIGHCRSLRRELETKKKLNKQNNAYIKHTLRVIAIFNCLSFQPKKRDCVKFDTGVCRPQCMGGDMKQATPINFKSNVFIVPNSKTMWRWGFHVKHYSIQDTIDSIDYMCIDQFGAYSEIINSYAHFIFDLNEQHLNVVCIC